MSDENTEIAPLCSFKPIDIDLPLLDNSTSNDSLLTEDNIVVEELQTPIFREVSNADGSNCPMQLVRQENAIDETKAVASATDDNIVDDRARRVISPYPFSHTSQEEIEEREQLTAAFSWALENRTDKPNGMNEKIFFQFDYTTFFEMNATLCNTTGLSNEDAMDCDDFSVASEVSDDLCLKSISENPSSFWGDSDHFSSKGDALNEVSSSRISLES